MSQMKKYNDNGNRTNGAKVVEKLTSLYRSPWPSDHAHIIMLKVIDDRVDVDS